MRVKKLLEQFFDACLIEGNVEKALTFASEKIMSFGTEEQEIARNKMELRALLERETAAVQKEEKFSYVLADYRESEYGEGMCGAFCFFVTAVEKKQEGAIRKKCRNPSDCMRKEGGGDVEACSAAYVKAYALPGERGGLSSEIWPSFCRKNRGCSRKKPDTDHVIPASRRNSGSISGTGFSSLCHQ